MGATTTNHAPHRVHVPAVQGSAGLRRLGSLLLLLALASACSRRDEAYGLVHDAGVSPDGATLLVLVERGRQGTESGNLFRGDITTRTPESMQIQVIDRASGRPGQVISLAPPATRAAGGRESLAPWAAAAGIGALPLPDCREMYSECAATTTPQPHRLGARVVDPRAGRMFEWDGRRLAERPFVPMTPAQVRTAREALVRRSASRVRATAEKDLALRSATEDPERIATGALGAAEQDPGMTALYRLLPGRVVRAQFRYAELAFELVWRPDGTCVADHADVARIVGCQAGDSATIDRVARGIALARPPDPDRTGTTWGVLAGQHLLDMPAGTSTVGCHGVPRETTGRPCDGQQGDTACRSVLPVLCSRADASFPPQSPFARQLALTAPVPGTALKSAAAGDQVCRAALGDGWTMTHADEQQHKYQVTGLGSLPATSRFWIRNGAGLANCW